jgi:hypothetical protein
MAVAFARPVARSLAVVAFLTLACKQEKSRARGVAGWPGRGVEQDPGAAWNRLLA